MPSTARGPFLNSRTSFSASIVLGRSTAFRLAAAAAGEEDRPDRHGDEREHADDPERAGRQRLAEADGPGGDRQRVRQERGEPCDRERAAVLVAELKERRAEAVSGDGGDAEGGSSAALRRNLHRDVSDREEQAARNALRDGDRPEAPAEGDGHDRSRRCAGEPELDLEGLAAAALAASS